MRVALVTTSWPAHAGDPAGHFVRAHARELEDAGHAVEVIAPPPGGAFGWPGAAARLRERPLRALGAVRWMAEARARVAGLRADLVVAHWCLPSAWPIAAASTAPLHAVSHGGDVRLLVALPQAVRHALVRATCRRAVAWDFASRPLLDDLAASLDGATRAVLGRVASVRAPPIDLPDVSAAAARRRREIGPAPLAVCVGRLVRAKRVDRVIDHVARSAPPLTLVVVGDGPERARLEERARARGIDGRFVGAVDRADALAWIGAADLLFHASEAEGLSTVIREAEALGTPVVRLGAAAV
jgi:teichuronic acid biosynthesis glycosyltransferase TuaC